MLSLNIKKTNFLVFHPYNKPVNKRITLKIHKNAISKKDQIKYLGIMIDATLTWKPHIEKNARLLANQLVYYIKLDLL